MFTLHSRKRKPPRGTFYHRSPSDLSRKCTHSQPKRNPTSYSGSGSIFTATAGFLLHLPLFLFLEKSLHIKSPRHFCTVFNLQPSIISERRRSFRSPIGPSISNRFTLSCESSNRYLSDIFVSGMISSVDCWFFCSFLDLYAFV